MLATRRAGDRVIFTVRVVPRAAATAVAGERAGALVVRVTAPPVDGRANEAVVALLAETLGVPRGDVRVESGATARTKIVSIPAGAEAALRRLAK